MPTLVQIGFIPLHGNYQELLSYQKAEVVYDITFRFCQRFLSRGDRDHRSNGEGRPIGKTEHCRRQ